ncbi:NF-kappa-B inhibitor alpha isoform X1 [Stomoxys calcitrans]|uniref:NF-kappa-B inhibitor alpha isoform X1 n=2 Tax=Stomoxys calcitrans TaxID=35570 RepID=UPI0027E27C09|nr:NF-kappa-B inhibitor alpha isoform X1 [Stomoxys calcitrans]
MEYRNVSKKLHGSPKFGSSMDWSDYAPERSSPEQSSPERSSNEVNATPTCSKQQPQRHRQHTMTSTKLKTISREHPNNLINKIKNINSLDELRRLIAEEWPSLTNDAYLEYPSPDYHKVLGENLQQFFIYLNDPKHHDNIISKENNLQQNLLHTCCKYNRYQAIIPLIRLGCNPAKQDYDGRTPLHLAIQLKDGKCIQQFLQLLRQESNPELIENLKGMFEPYNNIGQTIVHQAVLQRKTHIVKELLQFCNRNNINVLEREVLGNGKSLLHLAVDNKDYEMQTLIVMLVPKSIHAANYAGSLPIEKKQDIQRILSDVEQMKSNKALTDTNNEVDEYLVMQLCDISVQR